MPTRKRSVCLVRERVLADVRRVLRQATVGGEDPARVFASARTICQVLYAHPHTPDPDIPHAFWLTPLGRAIAVCCEGLSLDHGPAERLLLPPAIQATLRQEIEALNRQLARQVTGHGHPASPRAVRARRTA